VVLIGLIAGSAYLMERPPPYEATTSLLIASPPGAGVGQAINNDQTLVESLAVASDAVRLLGLQENPATLLSHYTALAATDQVLTITVKAPSADVAIREANGIAQAFLNFQAQLLNSQSRLLNASLQQQLNQGQQQISSLTTQLHQLSATAGSSAAEINSVKAARTQAIAALTVLKQTVYSTEASNEAGNDAVIRNSQVLDAATLVKQSHKKTLALYVGGGLIGGLVLGMAIVVVRALLSTRLRRREEVARILGAPVKLSIRKVPRPRLWRGRNWASAKINAQIQPIVRHLSKAVAYSSDRVGSLAVVPVDDVQLPAACLMSLAKSYAKQGMKVVVADLCPGAPAARMLGVRVAPGLHEASADGVPLVVAIPDADDLLPAGPLQRTRRAAARDPLATVCASGDVVLTLAWLDPALGAEHLAGWATSVVTMLTAGRSSAERVYAVGEMVRLAGVPAFSAVLAGADKSDESLGNAPDVTSIRAKEAQGSPASTAREPIADAASFVLRVSQGQRGRPLRGRSSRD